MRVVVTGSNGLVGRRLCDRLLAGGHDVFAVGRGPQRSGTGATYLSCDLAVDDVAAVLASAHPQVIFHPAAMTDVDACERDPFAAFRGNVLATAAVAQAARLFGAHLVHVSTDYVFDGSTGRYSETDSPNPQGAYARSKWMAEQAAQLLVPACTIARTAVVYGWPAAGRENFGSWLVRKLAAGERVKLFDDQWVSPTLADNLADMLVELGERRLEGIWNTAGADVVNRVEFGQSVCKVFGFDPSLVEPSSMAQLAFPAPRPPRSGLNVSKASGALAARPLNLVDALRAFHASWRESNAA